MIEPMKKVSIVLLNKEKEEALKALRRIGLVHLEKIEGAGEKLTAFKEYSNNAMLTESILGEIKLPKQKKGSAPSLSRLKCLCPPVPSSSLPDRCTLIVHDQSHYKHPWLLLR